MKTNNWKNTVIDALLEISEGEHISYRRSHEDENSIRFTFITSAGAEHVQDDFNAMSSTADVRVTRDENVLTFRPIR